MSEAIQIDEGFKYPDLKKLVRHCLDKKVSVLVKGHPGVGKSSMAMDIATDMGFDVNDPYQFIDIRLAQKDPVELCGMIAPNRERRISEWYRPSWVPVDRPAFIMLDEINSAVSKLHQAAAYQIVLERRVGDFKFHKDTVIMAAGNMEEDNAIVVPLSSALNNRFSHFILKPDVDAWLEWAARENLSSNVRAFIAFRRERVLYDNCGTDAFPTPRSWASGAKLDGIGDETMTKRLFSASVGEAHALEYMTFVKVYSRVDVRAIVENGVYPDLQTDANRDPAFLYALTFAVADYLKVKVPGTKEIGNVFDFFKKGFPREFQALMLRQIMPVADCLKALRAHPDFMTYAREFVDILI